MSMVDSLHSGPRWPIPPQLQHIAGVVAPPLYFLPDTGPMGPPPHVGVVHQLVEGRKPEGLEDQVPEKYREDWKQIVDGISAARQVFKQAVSTLYTIHILYLLPTRNITY